MATTWIKPLHTKKGKTIAHTLGERTDYAENPDKTEQGSLVAGYACEPRCADEQFLLDRKEYAHLTGRSQGRREVIAYHVRQSFKPGEITPQEALEVGQELAMRFTKGSHAFIVGVHTDRKHIHCHIIFNSTSIDHTRKFKNFWGSSFAVRRLSDLICAEHGLSVVENPQPSKGANYSEWAGNDKPPTHKETLKQAIDEMLPTCSAFEDFISRLVEAGYEVNFKRKHPTARLSDWGKPVRIDSLGDGYTDEALRARLGMTRIVKTGGDSGTKTRVSLLVDIQAKIREGKGQGYAQWAKIFNLKEAAKTLVFLKENGIDSYEDLKKKSSSASGAFAKTTQRIKEIEARQKEISELQKQIGTYSKTRDIYASIRRAVGAGASTIFTPPTSFCTGRRKSFLTTSE